MAKPRTQEMACPASAETRLGALESRDLARTALAAALAGKNLLNEAAALLRLGRIFTPSVEPQATLDAVTRAEQIFVAHSAPAHAAKCRVAAARALMDLGRERDAVERCKRALSEQALPAEHRVAGIVVTARSQAQFGRLDAALQLLRHSAAPLAETSSDESRIHVKKAVAMVQFQMLLAAEFPHLHRGLTFVRGEGTERPGGAEVLELLADIEGDLSADERWSHIEILRQLTLGLCEPGELAIECLSALAADNIAVDPPTAAWALYAQSLVHRNRRDLRSAQESVGRCLVISEQWGLKAIARYGFLQQSLIRESTKDYAGSLQAYKIFSALQLRSVTTHPEAVDAVAASKLPSQDPQDLQHPQDLQPPQDPAPAASLKPLESRHVKRAIRFIESNLSVPISVSDIAAECQVSRRTLEVAFKQSKSCTLASYVKRRRLETASGLLRFSALLVSEVANSVGYRWPSAFARDFVSHYGVRPSDWKARHTDEGAADPFGGV